MSMRKLRQEVDALRNEIEPFASGAMGGNLLSNRFQVIRHGAEDDALVADVVARAQEAGERPVILWIVDPPRKQEMVTL